MNEPTLNIDDLNFLSRFGHKKYTNPRPGSSDKGGGFQCWTWHVIQSLHAFRPGSISLILSATFRSLYSERPVAERSRREIRHANMSRPSCIAYSWRTDRQFSSMLLSRQYQHWVHESIKQINNVCGIKWFSINWRLQLLGHWYPSNCRFHHW